ncbi:glycohydrolase toxin TNT-related protein [Dickeya fangzhongdai]|uniref:glycohydrolase toxin TNT-related protein n=1 Tax=Dickeya fangzhongdai TaxID=1778540 RepID=UPI001CE2FD62|nr:glycohydrolase toxin TNT-related protein [Dickeya fangzhongdai]
MGRDLLVRSEQDSDRYDSKQQSVSAGVTIPIYGGGGGASFSFSRDKVHSNFDSVQEQSGLFAGSNGFDVTVGNHTQLDGGAIASTASAERNRLETGTLGFSNIDNRAEYSASHTGGGFSTSAPVGLQVLSNVGGLMLAGANQSGSSAGTTYAAVSDGTLVIRNPTGQQQDVSGLSRDTAGANSGALNPIFDKEKVESKLRQAQLLSEIGAQVLDIASAEGTINATKDANAGLAATSAEKRREKAASLAQASPDKVITQDDVTQALYQDYYHASLNASPYRTGGPVRQGIQAVTAALQGVLAGNVAQAVTGAAAPYLAEQIHKATTDAQGNTDVMANTIAHALLGAVVAESGGNSALAGAAGEAGGELAARALLETLYPGKKPEELNEDQKQLLSTLSTIAGGLAAGVAGNSGTDAVQGAQSAQVATENNYLSNQQKAQKKKELEECQTQACKVQAEAKWTAIDLGQDGSFAAGMVAGVPAGLYDTIDGIVKTASSPMETYEALKSLFNSGDVLGNVSDAVKQSYIDRINNMEAEYQKAGASGSFNAGVEGGKLVTDIAGLLAGGTGVVKVTAGVTEKIVAKVAGKAVGAEATNTAVSMADRIKANIAESQQARESSNFGQYSKAEGGVQETEKIWPPNRGAYGPVEKVTLPIGETVDRYGYPGGSFVSPVGVPFTERALPSSYETTRLYFQYEIIKPIPDVPKSKILPWFGQKGTGTQYELPKPVQWYLDNDYMKKVDK